MAAIPETPPNRPVLGVDPPDTTPQVTPPTVENPLPPEVPTGVTLTQEEYDDLTRNSEHYQTLMGDPQLKDMVYNHIRRRIAGTGLAPEMEEEQETPPIAPSNDPTVAALQKDMAQIRQFMKQGGEMLNRQQQVISVQERELAKLRADAFARENPSFNAHKQAVAQVLKQHPTMDLQDALLYVEAKAAKAGNGTVSRNKPAVPTTEGGGAGSLPGEYGVSDARLAEAAAKINDPKATPSLDSMLDVVGDLYGLRR